MLMLVLYALQIALPVEELSVEAVVDLEQTYAGFISAYEPRKEKNYVVLQAMRAHLSDFRLASLGHRPANLGPCGNFVVKGASLRQLGSPASAAIRLHQIAENEKPRAARLVKKNSLAMQKNESEFFKCMEREYPSEINEASLKADLEMIQKLAEKLIAQ